MQQSNKIKKYCNNQELCFHPIKPINLIQPKLLEMQLLSLKLKDSNLWKNNNLILLMLVFTNLKLLNK